MISVSKRKAISLLQWDYSTKADLANEIVRPYFLLFVDFESCSIQKARSIPSPSASLTCLPLFDHLSKILYKSVLVNTTDVHSGITLNLKPSRYKKLKEKHKCIDHTKKHIMTLKKHDFFLCNDFTGLINKATSSCYIASTSSSHFSYLAPMIIQQAHVIPPFKQPVPR